MAFIVLCADVIFADDDDNDDDYDNDNDEDVDYNEMIHCVMSFVCVQIHIGHNK